MLEFLGQHDLALRQVQLLPQQHLFARERGLESMIGWILATNDPMVHLCTRLGFRDEADDDPLTRKLVLGL